MTNKSDITQRMEELKLRIDQAEEKVKLREILHKDHQVTIDGLRRRYALLEQQLADETTDAEAKGHHIGSLEMTALRWINALNFDR